MDENTKHVVASNLTVAYFSAQTRKGGDPSGTWKDVIGRPSISPDEVYSIYQEFLAKLSSSEESPET
jgi:hypothetical protein